MQRRIIGFDLDDVIFDFIDHFRGFAAEMAGREIIDRPVDWAMSNWALTKEQMDDAWKNFLSTDEFQNLRPCKDVAYKAMHALAKDHTLYFITARPGDNAQYTAARSVRDHLKIELPTVIVTDNKGPVVAALGIEAFIDDRPKNLIQVWEHAPATKLFLRDQAHNRDWHEKSIGAARVHTLDEFLEEIL